MHIYRGYHIYAGSGHILRYDISYLYRRLDRNILQCLHAIHDPVFGNLSFRLNRHPGKFPSLHLKRRCYRPGWAKTSFWA